MYFIKEILNRIKDSTSIPAYFSLLFIIYILFIYLFSVIGFLLNFSISNITLPITFVIYVAFILIIPIIFKKSNFRSYYISVILFIVSFISLLAVSNFFISKTYDTSWDGQGYHSLGIINLKDGWNPVYDKDLSTNYSDGSIFVKGYPKAVWIIESIFYSFTGSLNAAKIVNIIMILISISYSYYALRLLGLRFAISSILSISIGLQSIPIIQSMTFMQDGISYGLLIICISSLLIFQVKDKSLEGLMGFISSFLLLICSKYSNLPIALILLVIFIFMFLRKLVLRKLVIPKNTIKFSLLVVAISILIPYCTNIFNNGYILFPTNYTEVSKTPAIDNIPENLKNSDRFSLIFYGIFGRSQSYQVGAGSPLNVSSLKVPFTLSLEEIEQSAGIFNNRTGAAGPLFSGSIILAFSILLLIYFYSRKNKKYNILNSTILLIILILAVSLISSVAPNLIRYNTQILLIPFIVLIVALKYFYKNLLIKMASYILMFVILLNSLLFFVYVIKVNVNRSSEINIQLKEMSGENVYINATRFYSNYIRLKENSIGFTVTDSLPCNYKKFLSQSSYTTFYCNNLNKY